MSKTENHDDQIIQLLHSDPERAIELLFKTHYTFLCQAIFRIIPDETVAEDLAQDVFFEIWKKKDTFQINTSFRAYLRRAGTNKALNYLRDKKIKWDDAEALNTIESPGIHAGDQLELAELEGQIHAAIKNLPERCRVVFSLSRFEALSYQEIADQLGISIKTVENQISKALRILRDRFGRYLSVGLLFGTLPGLL
ncbi:MAG: RNA polymerase sigma-70 factor [Bacteroidetes bacterium]|nr:MAG: RNA polymerase sigma-70 factor [Bacteroidota bacterium]